MSPTGYCPHCRSVQPLGGIREGEQSGLACLTCGHSVALAPLEQEAFSPPAPLILCIDDDRLLLSLFSDALERAGLRTTVAHDGPAGILAAQRTRPALILLDFFMPAMDGLEVCRRLRADPDLRSTPIILLTAIENPELSAQAREAGATLIMRKPFGPQIVVEQIKQLLGWQPGPETL